MALFWQLAALPHHRRTNPPVERALRLLLVARHGAAPASPSCSGARGEAGACQSGARWLALLHIMARCCCWGVRRAALHVGCVCAFVPTPHAAAGSRAHTQRTTAMATLKKLNAEVQGLELYRCAAGRLGAHAPSMHPASCPSCPRGAHCLPCRGRVRKWEKQLVLVSPEGSPQGLELLHWVPTGGRMGLHGACGAACAPRGTAWTPRHACAAHRLLTRCCLPACRGNQHAVTRAAAPAPEAGRRWAWVLPLRG